MMKINHDDNLLEVIEKVNAELLPHRLSLVDDGKEHDGFCLYALEVNRIYIPRQIVPFDKEDEK